MSFQRGLKEVSGGSQIRPLEVLRWIVLIIWNKVFGGPKTRFERGLSYVSEGFNEASGNPEINCLNNLK